jgi:hypothetical protein
MLRTHRETLQLTNETDPMMRYYAQLTAACFLLGLSASAQGLKPGVHPTAHAPAQQRGDAPANDECAGAIPITVGTSCTATSGNSANATQSMDPAEDCGPYISPEAFDMWYSFVANSALTTVDMTGIASYDAAVQVFSGPCGGLTPLGCADANYPEDPFDVDMTESLIVETTPGNTYYVRAYYYTSPVPESMDFTICAYNTTLTEYCTPSVTDCDEFIAGVTFGTIASTSDCTAGGYNDYTAQSTDLAVSTPTAITVMNNPASFFDIDAVTVWGDWNQDFYFAPSEATVLSTDDAGLTFAGMITAPAGAGNGETRLRVRMVYDAIPVPCGASDFGEVEDFTVNVTGGINIGIGEISEVKFSVFPNPSNGDVTLVYSDVSGMVNIELLDMTGRVVSAERRLLNQGQSVTLSNAGKVAAGNYALRLTSEQGRSAQHLVVK